MATPLISLQPGSAFLTALNAAGSKRSSFNATSPTNTTATATTTATGSNVSDTASSGGVLSDEILSSPLTFQKTLTSDVQSDHSIELLHETHELDPIWSELFESADMQMVNDILSILTFEPGERIITFGEDATFAAVVLQGELICEIPPSAAGAPSQFFPLSKSSWVGEMAYFEHGPRNADITSKTKSVLAVLSYDDLDRLALDGQGELQRKFIQLLAIHSLKKLRGMLSKSSSPPTTPAALTSTTNSASSEPPVTPTPTTAAAAAAKEKPHRKQETLFVARLKKQAEALAAQEAKQKSTLANMQSLVKKREAEAAYAHATVKMKITKLENENKDLTARINDLTKKLTNEKKRLKESQDVIARLNMEKGGIESTLSDVERKIQDEKMKVQSLHMTREEIETAHNAALKAKDDELALLQTQLTALRDEITQVTSQRDAASAQHQGVIAERDQALSEIPTLHNKLIQVDHEKALIETQLKTAQELKDQYENETVDARRKCTEYQENYEKLLMKYRTDMFESGKEKKKITQSHKTYHKLIRMLTLKTYVRNFLIRRFLFNIHLRASEMVVNRWEEKLDNLHHIQREDALHRAGGSGSATVGKDSIIADSTSLYQQLAQANSKSRKLHQSHPTHSPSVGHQHSHHPHHSQHLSLQTTLTTTSSPLDLCASEPDSPMDTGGSTHPLVAPYALSASNASTTLDSSNPASQLSVFAYTAENETQHYPKEQLRLEKKKYLYALKNKRNPPPSIISLLQSIEEELIELKTPVDEMALNLVELRSTLDSFFKRNIQLTAKCLNTKKALEVACANYDALKNSVRQRHLQESNANPFTANLLLETAKQQLAARKAAAVAGINNHPSNNTAGGLPPSTLVSSLTINSSSLPPLSVQDEEKDMVGLLTPTAMARPGTTPSHGPRKSISGDIDWEALDHEKSSGYGVIRPMKRRESKLIQHLPPGSSLLPKQNRTGAAAAPSGSPALTPRPPSSSSASHSSTSVTPMTSPTNTTAATFALPKV